MTIPAKRICLDCKREYLPQFQMAQYCSVCLRIIRRKYGLYTKEELAKGEGKTINPLKQNDKAV